MSQIIVEYRSIQYQIKELERGLAAITANPDYGREMEFEAKLRNLMAIYGKSLRDVVLILDPDAERFNLEFQRVDKVHKARGSYRGPRAVQTYKNPHTGEVVETAGGNHKTLKQWRHAYPHTDLKTWIVKDA